MIVIFFSYTATFRWKSRTWWTKIRWYGTLGFRRILSCNQGPWLWFCNHAIMCIVIVAHWQVHRVTPILTDSCRNGQLYWLTVVLIDSCTDWQLYWLTPVVSDCYTDWQLQWVTAVLTDSCNDRCPWWTAMMRLARFDEGKNIYLRSEYTLLKIMHLFRPLHWFLIWN